MRIYLREGSRDTTPYFTTVFTTFIVITIISVVPFLKSYRFDFANSSTYTRLFETTLFRKFFSDLWI